MSKLNVYASEFVQSINNHKVINEVLRIFCRNKIFCIVDFLILLFSGIFALTVAIIIAHGWIKTCDTVHDM